MNVNDIADQVGKPKTADTTSLNSEKPRRLALFDFDDTLIRGDSINALVRRMYQEELMSVWQMLRLLYHTLLWRLGRKPVEPVKSMALSPLRRLDEAAATDFLQRFVQQDLVPQLYPEGVDMMMQHHQAGDVVLLVSASPLCYLQHIKEFLPVDAVLATPHAPGYQITHNLIREAKPKAIKAWLGEAGITIDWQQSFAYSDSANDLPLLRMVGNPHWINPKAKALRLAKDIPVLHWGEKN